MTVLAVPAAQFDELARGRGGLDGALHAGQRSKRLLLVHELVTTARARIPQQFAEAGGDVAYGLLAEAQRTARHAADEVLLQPHVGAWATRCLRTILREGSAVPADLGHLGAVAAAAALRSGLGFEVTVHARDGAVMFPTYGAARAPIAGAWCCVRARSGSGGVEITSRGATWAVPFGPAATATWTPLRRLRAAAGGIAVEVTLDDLDPYRGCEALPVAGRLDDEAARGWQAAMDDGWALLVRDHRPVAEAVANAVVSLVPLVATADAPELSGTCFEAIGAVAMTEPRTPVGLALALAHELRHTVLSALLDLVPLVGPHAGELFYAPWRKDPRPLSGLLQGTYAWLGLAEFWDARRRQAPASGASPDAARTAEFELALARRQTGQGLDTLHRSGLLTPPGQRFVAGMRRRLADLVGVPVAAEARRLAELACLDHRTGWRLRNVRPDPGLVATWAEAWLAGRPFRWTDGPPATVADGGGPLPSDTRLQLIRRRLAGQTEAPDRAARPADEALIAGDAHRAVDAYREVLKEDPDDLASWSGLVVALAAPRRPGAWALRTHPEVVAALHREIRLRCGAAPDPERVADWLGRGAPPG